MFKFHDVFSLDDDIWSAMVPQPVIAVILLYQIKKEHKDLFAQQEQPEVTKESPFFIKQKISNACGTIALLHALFNTKEQAGGYQAESFLEEFMFLHEKSTPDERAEALNNDQKLEETHQSAAM